MNSTAAALLLTLITACTSSSADDETGESDACALACELLHGGGERNCTTTDLGSEASYAAAVADCTGLCAQVREAGNREWDDYAEAWAYCALSRKDAIQADWEEYGEADAEECQAAYDECGRYPCEFVTGGAAGYVCQENGGEER